MPFFWVETPQRRYPIVVERGGLSKLREHIPTSAGKVFFISTEDVWQLHGGAVSDVPHELLIFRGGEARKRPEEVEGLAEQMVARGADRPRVVVAIGGGILTDAAGVLAAIFMRRIPVLQLPTPLLNPVDAAICG